MTTRPTGRISGVVCLALALLLATAPAWAEVLPHNLKLQLVLDSSSELGDVEQSPTGELWLLERAGTVRVFVAGAEQATLTIPVMTDCESGLLDVAFAPDYGQTGLAFVYYVDGTGAARVDQIYKRGAGLELGANVLSPGSTTAGCRPGGGLAVGDDGMLYVTVGDLEDAADAQDDGSLAGKVLRAEQDGSVPADNASGTLVWAKGFRNGRDLDVGGNGLVYLVDMGFGHDASDETNAVHEGGNFGWDFVSGDSGGAYDDPLTDDMPIVGVEGISMLESDALGAEHQDTLMYTCASNGEIRQAVLNGGTELDHWNVFYDALGDADGTPDAGCPQQFTALAEGGEGWLYGGNSGDNPGIWRVWHDDPGPREVSPPGSPIPMVFGKTETGYEVYWEDHGSLDARRPTRHGDQHARPYQLWEGELTNVADYAHVSIAQLSGAVAGPARRVNAFTPGDGNRYYLMSSQNDNLEGTTGAASDGTPRGGETDYCPGYGIYPPTSGPTVCAQEWIDHSTGGELKLRDLNPHSVTNGQLLNLGDFRGKVIRMDLSADNCYYCNLQAPIVAGVEHDYHSRDFVAMTVLTLSYSGVTPIPPASCQAYVTAWANEHGITGPIFCDPDRNGDNHGDVTWQWWRVAGCNGSPQNFYIDQGHAVYQFVCGGELSAGQIISRINSAINPETCE